MRKKKKQIDGRVESRSGTRVEMARNRRERTEEIGVVAEHRVILVTRGSASTIKM